MRLSKFKRHFSRYTPEMVEKVCGIPPDLFHKVAHALAAASGPERTAAVCYAVGWTQAFEGARSIRAAAILAIAAWKYRPAWRRNSGIARSCFDPGFNGYSNAYDILPGYLTMPRKGDETLSDFDKYTKKTGLWAHYPNTL